MNLVAGKSCSPSTFSDHKQGDETDRNPESLLRQLFVCNPYEVNFMTRVPQESISGEGDLASGVSTGSSDAHLQDTYVDMERGKQKRAVVVNGATVNEGFG